MTFPVLPLPEPPALIQPLPSLEAIAAPQSEPFSVNPPVGQGSDQGSDNDVIATTIATTSAATTETDPEITSATTGTTGTTGQETPIEVDLARQQVIESLTPQPIQRPIQYSIETERLAQRANSTVPTTIDQSTSLDRDSNARTDSSTDSTTNNDNPESPESPDPQTSPPIVIPDAGEIDPAPLTPASGAEAGGAEAGGTTAETQPGTTIAPLNPPLNPAPNSPADLPEVNGSNLQEPLRISDPLEVTADRQTFDRDRQIFTAIGNVTMRYAGTLLEADRLQVNMLTRMARAEGNIALTQGNGTILRGEEMRYNFAQEIGTMTNVYGELSFVPETAATPPRTLPVPATTLLPVPIGSRYLAEEPPSDRQLQERPTDVFNTGGLNFSIGAGRQVDAFNNASGVGTLNRFRFDATEVDFTSSGWTATDVRITTDPFSPPESELRADRATMTPLDPLRDELLFERPRAVFDQGFSVPILRRRYIIDRSERQPPIVTFGFDQRDRDGFFIQRRFRIINTPNVQFQLAPQYYVQRALTGGGSNSSPDTGSEETNGILDPGNFGFTSRLRVRFDENMSLAAETSLTNLDPSTLDLNDDLRASVRLSRRLGRHRLTGEYTFRNRLFNGSLGFRTVHSSLGLVLSSEPMFIGDTGVVLNYQAGFNRINADTDQLDLLKSDRETNRVSLNRFQASFGLDRGWTLWQGDILPATAEEGLRFSPYPVRPYIRTFASVRGIWSLYSDDYHEATLRGTIGIQAQFGHFAKTFLDYTSLFARYSETLIDGQSPFPFDRVADRRVLSLGFLQQIAGPLRFGIQTSINLENNDIISTDYVFEYSRRTYGIVLSFNPEREAGYLQLRLSDFDWNGDAGAFSNRETCQGIGDLLCDSY